MTEVERGVFKQQMKKLYFARTTLMLDYFFKRRTIRNSNHEESNIRTEILKQLKMILKQRSTLNCLKHIVMVVRSIPISVKSSFFFTQVFD